MADPYCLAMVLCDHVHRDLSTGKCTIIGTCNSFFAREFPARIAFDLYLAITDGLGPTRLAVRLVTPEYSLDQDKGELIIQVESDQFDIESPLVVLECAMKIGTTVNAPGQYHCDLLINDCPIMSRRIVVVHHRPEETEEK